MGFLAWILNEMGFSGRWVQLIMSCVTSVSFQVLINGQASISFTPSRGIRQGDPLSPYLFLFVLEGLSALIREEERREFWKGLRMGRGGPVLSHLFFADDSLLFCRADDQGLATLSRVLKAYEVATGQKINYGKSSVFIPNCIDQEIRENVVTALGMSLCEGKGKYLGLPYLVGRTKREVFAFLKERVCKKTQG